MIMYISIVEDDNNCHWVEIDKEWDIERFKCISESFYHKLMEYEEPIKKKSNLHLVD